MRKRYLYLIQVEEISKGVWNGSAVCHTGVGNLPAEPRVSMYLKYLQHPHPSGAAMDLLGECAAAMEE